MVRDLDKEQHHLGHVLFGLLVYYRKQNPKKGNVGGEGGVATMTETGSKRKMSSAGSHTGGKHLISGYSSVQQAKNFIKQRKRDKHTKGQSSINST